MKTTPTLSRRAVPIESIRRRESGSDDVLELELAFASEEPVERFFGKEILVVEPGAARLERVAQGVAPLLEDHRELVGRVLSVKIGRDRIARAVVRFSRSVRAAEIVQDVLDGIRKAVSFGYRVHRMELASSGDDGDVFRVVDWELFEISIVAMPADPTVGIGRGFDQDDSAFAEPLKRARQTRRSNMTISHNQLADLDETQFEEAVRSWAPDKKATAIEAVRKIHLGRVARNFKAPDGLLQRALERGAGVDEFLSDIREDRERSYERAGQGPLNPPAAGLGFERSLGTRDDVYGMDSQDLRGASITAVVRSHLTGRPQDAAASMEVFDHMATRAGREPRDRGGFFVPHDVLTRMAYPNGFQTRVVGVGVGGNLGAALKPTEHMAGMFEHALREQMVVGALGVRMLTGLRGDGSLPIGDTDPEVDWVGEGLGSGSSDAVFSAGLLQSKTMRSRVDLTRKMILNGLPDADQLVSEAIISSIARALERAIFAGTGADNQPEGILSTSGVGAPTFDTASGTAEYQSMIAAATEVADADADLGSTAFVLTPAIRGRFQGKFIDPGSGQRIWESGSDPRFGEVAGYRAGVTNLLPRDLGAGTNEHAILFGDWSQIVVGLWSGVDLQPDQVTLGDSGGLVLRGFQDADVLVRRAVAFSAMQVAPTA